MKNQKQLLERGYQEVSKENYYNFFLDLYSVSQERKTKIIEKIKQVMQELKIDPGRYIIPILWRGKKTA